MINELLAHLILPSSGKPHFSKYGNDDYTFYYDDSSTYNESQGISDGRLAKNHKSLEVSCNKKEDDNC